MAVDAATSCAKPAVGIRRMKTELARDDKFIVLMLEMFCMMSKIINLIVTDESGPGSTVLCSSRTICYQVGL